MARQFEDVGPNSIGWLFVDEAGQAVPQAAVGALLRAKRAIVIGDPLQIEPVFTLPKHLISELANTSQVTESGDYSPDRVSAQVLADQANSFGTSVSKDGDETIWIGSPLRVHRRCIDPMFGLANRIAYEDRMVFGLSSRSLDPDQVPYLGETCWIHLPETAQGRQAVPEQTEFVARLIAEFYFQFGAWPKLYVISPFKEVKEQISNRLQAPVFWADLGVEKPHAKTLRNWASSRIGTVHTFQGKEEDTVIMVLGADQKKEGAARWAASKPNILNVALTRAKRRFYLVGDRQLWGELRFFQEAFRELPIESPSNFSERAKKEWKRRDNEKLAHEQRIFA
ncbi:DEAD/DEAH box helicase [Pseudovibrio ascidiaceicola]|uniref:DEAD/DEAH box helicase n=1 Tax=Pseudovibrio ascidiaceicola TaxID=285279 RepID=UPI003D359B21